jgi:truncated hemoglobin YjbI
MVASGVASIPNPFDFVRTFKKEEAQTAPDAVKNLLLDPVTLKLRGQVVFQPPPRPPDSRTCIPRKKHERLSTFSDACRVKPDRGASLYDRIGGDEALQHLVKLLAGYMKNLGPEASVLRTSPLVEVPFLQFLLGGPGGYEGLTLKDAFKDDPMTDELFDHYVSCFFRCLSTIDVSNLVIKEFEFLFNVLKRDLVFELETETPPPPPPPEPEPIEADVLAENLVPATVERPPTAPEAAPEPLPPLDDVEADRPQSPAKQIAGEYVQQVLQSTIATNLVRDSIQQAVEAQRTDEIAALQNTIKDLQAQLREAVEAKNMMQMALTSGASLADTSMSASNLNATQYQLEGDEPHPVSPGGVDENGFVVDFEIDPQTMEVRVDIVGGQAAVQPKSDV